MAVASLATLLAAAWAVAGRAGLGSVLDAAYALQITPSIWTAYGTDRPEGISPTTWLLILTEMLCWGVYGLHKSDLQLSVLGWEGVAVRPLPRQSDRHLRLERTVAM
jgi:hypothetical protein